MTGKERMMTAMRRRKADHVPVCPDISVMVPAKLTGKPFYELFLDGRVHNGWTSATYAEAYVEAVKGGADAATAQREFDAALGRFVLIDSHDTVLKVKDPKEGISYFSFVEADGTVTPAQRHDETGLLALSPQGRFTSDDTSLRIHTKSPRTVTRWAVTLKDVPLP